MISRFRPSHSAIASPTGKNCGGEPACACCAAIARARQQASFDSLPEWCSPLTPDVQLVNLSHSEDGRKLRVDLGSDWSRIGITQRVEFTPNSLPSSDGWWFASDDETGLHFCPDLLTRITLETHSHDPGGKRTVLRAMVEDGTTALLLTAGPSVTEDTWQTLLTSIA